jgi:FlaA1/EpsC-like NDP-sugar epimerase
MKLDAYNITTMMARTSSSSSRRSSRRQLLELLCSPVLVVVTILVLSVVTMPINGYISPRPITTTAFARKLDGRSSTSLLMASSSSSSSSKYKKVFVAGGSKGVGHAIVEKLSERGAEVIALVRSEESKKELDKIEGVTAILGDAFDQKGVENAMDGCDAAIATLGGTTDDRRVDYEGNNNVIESAGILGVQRIILVTSIGW